MLQLLFYIGKSMGLLLVLVVVVVVVVPLPVTEVLYVSLLPY
jgi:hypothetical protein